MRFVGTLTLLELSSAMMGIQLILTVAQIRVSSKLDSNAKMFPAFVMEFVAMEIESGRKYVMTDFEMTKMVAH